MMLRAMDHFEVRARFQELQSHERNKWFIANKRHREKNEILRDRAEQDIVDLVAVVILTDPVEISEFKVELDTYDALTIEAIMENRAILEKLNQHRAAMLENAYQLEDGTRVFKSEDGTRVFDENEKLVSVEIVAPDEIDDRFTKAEPFFENNALISKHETVDQNLIGFQDKLDEARGRIDSGELTQKEFDTLRDDLKRDMPIEIRRNLSGYDQSSETDLKADFTSTAKTATLSFADMVINPANVPGLD